MKKTILSILTLGICCASCENSDWSFPDYDYSSVYFAQQSPIRTITLGEDAYDTSIDNEHKCQIMATLGGVYQNNINRIVSIRVDESLCNGLTYEDGTPVQPMTASYYSLADDRITIPKGKFFGGVEVQLTDAFFNDPKSVNTTYVIPVRMTAVENADTILEDKNYTLYAVKYVNKWHGNWLSSGTDVIDDNGVTSTVKRTAEYVENYEVRTLTTTAYMQVVYPVSTVVEVYNPDGTLGNKTLTCDLLLTFDASDNCVITTTTADCTASGSGKWEYHAAKKAWGDKDRDRIDLKYELTFSYRQREDGPVLYKKYTCEDQLIARDRGSKLETFNPKSN